MNVGQRLLDVPFPEMVYNLALAIAGSQANLDRESIEILRIMGDKNNHTVYIPRIGLNETTGEITDDDENLETSMIGAGFQPTFYQFAETIIEVKMAVSMTREYNEEGDINQTKTKVGWNKRGLSIRTTTIDATYSSKYNFTQEGSSTVRTRLVPVPPNTFIQRLLEMKAQSMQLEHEAVMRKIELAIEKQREELAE